MNEWYMYQPDSSIPTHFRISSLFLDILDTAQLFVVYDYIYIIYIYMIFTMSSSEFAYIQIPWHTHRNTNIFTPVAQHGDPLISKPVVPLWLPGHPGFWGASHPILGAPTIGWREHFVWKTMEDLFVWRLEETWFPWFPYVSLKHFLLITQLHVYRETPWIPICQMTHTDLKPENILLAANAPPRRSDFPREDAWKDCRGAWGRESETWWVVKMKWPYPLVMWI